jgi:hypothetical protein
LHRIVGFRVARRRTVLLPPGMTEPPCEAVIACPDTESSLEVRLGRHGTQESDGDYPSLMPYNLTPSPNAATTSASAPRSMKTIRDKVAPTSAGTTSPPCHPYPAGHTRTLTTMVRRCFRAVPPWFPACQSRGWCCGSLCAVCHPCTVPSVHSGHAGGCVMPPQLSFPTG